MLGVGWNGVVELQVKRDVQVKRKAGRRILIILFVAM